MSEDDAFWQLGAKCDNKDIQKRESDEVETKGLAVCVVVCGKGVHHVLKCCGIVDIALAVISVEQ